MPETKLQSLLEIFNDRFFRIPDYQRGYSWTEDQLEDFWHDLEILADDGKHYTGLLTVEEVSIDKAKGDSARWVDDMWRFSNGYKAFYVVDGQQRLTTVIILIKVLLDKFEGATINTRPKDEMTRKFLYQEEATVSYVFGYERDNPSDEFFKTRIMGRNSAAAANVPETLYTMNLEKARDYFSKKLQGLEQDKLARLFKKLSLGLMFNFYQIDTDLA